MSDLFRTIMEGQIDDVYTTIEDEVFTEAVKAEKIDYLKTYPKQIFLPFGSIKRGRGNVAMVYSRSFQETIDVINNKENCIGGVNYPLYYFNMLYQGKIHVKKFRYRLSKERKELYQEIKDKTSLIPKLKLSESISDNKNLYYDLYKYIEIFTSLAFKAIPLKYIELYWDYMKKIYSIKFPNRDTKFVVCDLNNYKLTKNLKENLTNPLYIIFFTLYKKPELLADINIDYYFYVKNKVLKINPSLLTKRDYITLKVEMNRIMKNVVNDDVMTVSVDEKEIDHSELLANASLALTTVVKVDKTPDVITNDEELKELTKTDEVDKELEVVAKKSVEKAVSEVKPDTTNEDEVNVQVAGNIKKEVEDNHELLKKIYYQNKNGDKAEKSTASTARDELLRKNQKNLKVKNMTLDKIISIKTKDVKIPITDISDELTTTNQNMSKIRFSNLDTTYIKEVMEKDIMDAFLALNDKSIPLFIRDIKIEDSSDELNYKDTYTIYMEDGNRNRHTVKVDIPKFIDNRFLYIGGNKKVIKHQSFYLPVVKIAPNKVEIVTNYSKMTIEREDGANSSSVERMKKLIVANKDTIGEAFKVGYEFPNNKKYITTIEYDQYSKLYSYFKYKGSMVYFRQSDALQYAVDNKITIPENHIFIGLIKGEPVFIDIDTQLTDKELSITDLIVSCLPQELETQYHKTKSAKRMMFAKVKIMRQNVYVGMLLGFWAGLSKLLELMKVQYRVVDKLEKALKPNEEYIKFSDCYMIYEQNIPISLILNGLRMFKTEKYQMADFDTKTPYSEYILKVYGSAITENALMNFYEFVLDPITIDVLEQLELPTEIVELYICAINLLADSQHSKQIDQRLSRIRCAEIIPAILYERLAKNYVEYRNSNGAKKYTVPQNAVIQEILAQKTVEDYSTLNPTLEMEQLQSVSTKGFRGVNLDDSYTIERRSFDKSMTGIMAANTSPDGGVGVSRTLTMEPAVTNIRGIVEDTEHTLNDMNDVNLYSAGEMTMPLCNAIDDPNRLG